MLLVAALFFGSVGGLVVAAILKRWVCQKPALTPRGRIQREIWGMRLYMLICWNWLESHLVSESTAKSAFHCLLSLTTKGKGVGWGRSLLLFGHICNCSYYRQEVPMSGSVLTSSRWRSYYVKESTLCYYRHFMEPRHGQPQARVDYNPTFKSAFNPHKLTKNLASDWNEKKNFRLRIRV